MMISGRFSCLACINIKSKKQEELWEARLGASDAAGRSVGNGREQMSGRGKGGKCAAKGKSYEKGRNSGKSIDLKLDPTAPQPCSSWICAKVPITPQSCGKLCPFAYYGCCQGQPPDDYFELKPSKAKRFEDFKILSFKQSKVLNQIFDQLIQHEHTKI